MKKILCVIAALALALTAAACGRGGTEAPSADSESVSAQSGEAAAAKNEGFPDLRDFTLKTLDGGTFTPADFAAKDLTVVNFWATFCGPCLSEMGDLAEFERGLPDNVALVTYCTDAEGNTDGAASLLEQAGYTGVALYGGEGDIEGLLQNIMYVPTTLFFDSDGVCVGSEIIGAQSDFAAAYTEAINATLALLGKDAI